MVFPFNRMGPQHFSSLADGGITSVRWRDEGVRLSYPVRDDSGVYRLTESLNLRRPRYCTYTALASTLLAEADRRHAAFHAWFHPSEERGLLQHEFKDLLALLQQRHREGRTWVTTMQALTAYCEAREQTRMTVESDDGVLRVSLDSRYDAGRYGDTYMTLMCPGDVKSAAVRTRSDMGSSVVSVFAGMGSRCVNVPHDALLVDLTR
jgi:hypothetical protein